MLTLASNGTMIDVLATTTNRSFLTEFQGDNHSDYELSFSGKFASFDGEATMNPGSSIDHAPTPDRLIPRFQNLVFVPAELDALDRDVEHCNSFSRSSKLQAEACFG